MSSQDSPTKRIAIFLPPGEGRVYPMGRISAVFKADGDETLGQYSISEWSGSNPTRRAPERTPMRKTIFSM